MSTASTVGPTGATTGRLFGWFARVLSIAKGDPVAARAYISAQWGWSDAGVLDAAFKTAEQPLGVDAYAGSGGPVFQDLAALLRPLTIIGKLAALMRPVLFNTRMVQGTGGALASWVVGGQPTPVAYAAYELTAQLGIKKVACIAVLNNEAVRNSAPKADMVVSADIVDALAAQMDASFIDPALGETEGRPASVTHGAATHESSGATVAAIDADLKTLMLDLVTAGMPLTSATWVMSPVTATHLSLLRDTSGALAYPTISALGGSLGGLRAITSTACAASGSPGERFIALVEAAEICLADDGAGELEFAEHASIQMSDAPAAGAQTLTSLWTSGMIALKGARYCNWRARRSGAVAVLRSVQY